MANQKQTSTDNNYSGLSAGIARVDYLTFSDTASNLCLKCARTRLAAGLRPDPLGELKRSPRPPSHKKGAYF